MIPIKSFKRLHDLSGIISECTIGMRYALSTEENTINYYIL